jgi:hypothetical protein
MSGLEFFKKNIGSIFLLVMFFLVSPTFVSADYIDAESVFFSNTSADYSATSTDLLIGQIYIPPLHDYDFGVFTCTAYGNNPSITLDDFLFQGHGTSTASLYYTFVNSTWSQMDIIVRGDILPGLWNYEIDISASPSSWFCDFSVFDFSNKTIGEVSRDFSRTDITTSYSDSFPADSDEDRFFLIKMQHCPSCGDLNVSSDWDDIIYTNENPFHDDYFSISWDTQSDGDGTSFSASLPGKNGAVSGQGFIIELLDSEDIETDLDPDAYYTIGDYVVPQTINCYSTDDFCRMVFGYNFSAYSRALTEADPDDQEYPAFGWWWPDTTATTSVYEATLRDHIERGEQMYATFSFATPTSTTNYTLEIEDPGDSVIGSSTSFVVDVNLISSSTGSIMATCLGSCDDGLLGDIFCGIKQAVCYFVIPSEDATLYIRAGYEKISSVAPLSYITGLTASMRSGMTQEDDRSGAFGFPMIDKTGDIYMQDVLTASSVSNLIGEENENNFRLTITYLIWIFLSLGIIIFLIHRSR